MRRKGSCEWCPMFGGGCPVCAPAAKPWRVVRTDTGAAVLFARSAREAEACVHYALRGLPLRVETADGR
jgi:hypothetical protein